MDIDKVSLSVTNLRNDIESEIEVLDDKISLKVSRGTVQSMIDVSLEEITISASQIKLEGYTTINGGFSIDNYGNMKIENEDSYCYLDGYNLNVLRKDFDLGGSYGASAISHFGIQWMTVVNAGTDGLERYIMLGTPSKKINDLYVSKINNYTPITSGNIDNYLSDLEIPDIVITNHTESANGGYYYGTNSTEASNYNKSIPTMQWVMNYVDEVLNS